MDFDVSVFVITHDKQYIPASEYVKGLDGEGVFVMLTNDELNTEFGDDNSICIYRDWLDVLNKTKDELKSRIKFENTDKYVSCPWQIEYKDIPNTFKLNKDTDKLGDYDTSERDVCVRKYLDGRRSNQEVVRNVVSLLEGRTIEKYLPAIMVARHTQATFDDLTIHGYLPAIGQLRYMSVNLSEINAVLKKIGVTVIALNSGGWWSATEYHYTGAWLLYNGTTSTNYKTDSWQVLPLFAI